jgi:endoglucanase
MTLSIWPSKHPSVRGRGLGIALVGIVIASAAAWAGPGAMPFPSVQIYTPGVIQPNHVSQAQMNQAVADHHAAWKASYLRTDGGDGTWVAYDKKRTATVSEAHGYGMVLAAYMDEEPLFDEMLRYFHAHPSVNAVHLMAWKQVLRNGRMVDVEGPDSATDGDMDIAYSLLLADRQWGSTGAHDYRGEALKVLHDILKHEVDAELGNLTPGDWAHDADARHTRPSDFMTSHLLAFAQADPTRAARWSQVHATVVTAVNDQFSRGSEGTGLMPDFMVRANGHWVPTPGKYLETRHDGDFSYNACRTPWRLAMSYIVLGRDEILAAQQQQVRWIRQATADDPARIRAGYFVLNGANGQPFVHYADLAFTAPLAVNAMLGGPEGQAWMNRLWDSMNGRDWGPVVDYYGDSLRLMAELVVSGNWWQP